MRDELYALCAEHRTLDAKLTNLRSRGHLSEREQLECKRLKKLKLRTKDRMSQLERALA